MSIQTFQRDLAHLLQCFLKIFEFYYWWRNQLTKEILPSPNQINLTILIDDLLSQGGQRLFEVGQQSLFRCCLLVWDSQDVEPLRSIDLQQNGLHLEK